MDLFFVLLSSCRGFWFWSNRIVSCGEEKPPLYLIQSLDVKVGFSLSAVKTMNKMSCQDVCRICERGNVSFSTSRETCDNVFYISPTVQQLKSGPKTQIAITVEDANSSDYFHRWWGSKFSWWSEYEVPCEHLWTSSQLIASCFCWRNTRFDIDQLSTQVARFIN